MPTSTAAFIGETERGPLRPRLVTSYKDYQRWFGETLADDRFLPHAARAAGEELELGVDDIRDHVGSLNSDVIARGVIRH